MKSVTKRQIKCRWCREKFRPPNRGRHPQYCSPACRQAAYRKRANQPHRVALRLLKSDLYAAEDQAARARAAVKVLKELGYDVYLEKRSGPLPKKPGPKLKAVE